MQNTALALNVADPLRLPAQRIIKPKRWSEKHRVISLPTLASPGIASGEKWLHRFEVTGLSLSPRVRSILTSPHFHPAPSGTLHSVKIVRGKVFGNEQRTTEAMRRYVSEVVYGEKPKASHLELACLIRDAFTDDELRRMGLSWIVVMHKPLENENGEPHQLTVCRRFRRFEQMDVIRAPDEGKWFSTVGFAFSTTSPPTRMPTQRKGRSS